MLKFYTHPKFWQILGRPLQDVRFHPILNFGHFLGPLPGHRFDHPKCR